MSLVSCGEIRQVFYPVFNEHFPKRDVQVSATNAEGPPVPIPNTEVKLCSAEDTWLATARENRSVLTSCLSSPLREEGFFVLQWGFCPFSFYRNLFYKRIPTEEGLVLFRGDSIGCTPIGYFGNGVRLDFWIKVHLQSFSD